MSKVKEQIVIRNIKLFGYIRNIKLFGYILNQIIWILTEPNSVPKSVAKSFSKGLRYLRDLFHSCLQSFSQIPKNQQPRPFHLYHTQYLSHA